MSQDGADSSSPYAALSDSDVPVTPDDSTVASMATPTQHERAWGSALPPEASAVIDFSPPEVALRKRAEFVTFAATEPTIVPTVQMSRSCSEEIDSEGRMHETESEASDSSVGVRRRTRMALRRRNRGMAQGGLGIVTVSATADSYKMKELRKFFQPADIPSLFNDVVLLHLPAYGGEQETVVFFFSYGVTVWWGSERVGQRVLHQLKSFEVKPEAKVECELYVYSDRAGDRTVVTRDHFYLHNKTIELKLAMSSALAQSLKLVVLENRIEEVILQTERYPEILEREGSARLAALDTAKLKGHLFLLRMTVNLHSDILDTPDFFWERSDLKPIYLHIREYMDIDKRVKVLNKRLMIVDEMFVVLDTVQHGTHAVKLELIVLGVIVVNVLFAVCLLWKQYSRLLI